MAFSLQLDVGLGVCSATSRIPHASNAEFVTMSNVQRTIDNAICENPEVRLVLEISARAREIEQREPPRELTPTSDIGLNPTAAQGVIPSGHVLEN